MSNKPHDEPWRQIPLPEPQSSPSPPPVPGNPPPPPAPQPSAFGPDGGGEGGYRPSPSTPQTPAFGPDSGSGEGAYQPVRPNLAPSDVDRVFDQSLDGSSPSTPYATTYQLKQGLAGERLATESLSAQGHEILSYKPDISGTNQAGIDMVTLKDGVVYVVDNKAYTTGRNVDKVPALQENYEQNKQAVIKEFRDYAADPERSACERGRYAYAVDQLEQGNEQKAVTGAAVAADGKHTQGISSGLAQEGFVFLETSPAPTPPSSGLPGLGPNLGR